MRVVLDGTGKGCVWKYVLGVLLLALLVPAAGMAQEQVVLQVTDGMFFWQEDPGSPGGPAVQAFVEEFMERHPDIKIEMVSNPRSLGTGYGNVMAWYATRAASQAMPDIFWVHNWNSGELIENGFVLDLSPYIDRDTSFNKDEFPALSWGAWQRGERIYGIPTAYTAYVPMVNLMLTREAGLADPDGEAWSLNDLTMYLRRLTKDTNGDGENEQWGGESRMFGFYSAALRPFGAEFLNEDETEVLIDSPEGIEALEFWKDLIVDQRLISRQSNLFYRGEAGFVVHEPVSLSTELGQQGTVEAQAYLTPTITPPIVGPGGGHYGVAIGSAWMVSAQTKHPEAAWTFLSELMATETMIRLAEAGVPGTDGRIPAARVTMEQWKQDWPSFDLDRYVQALTNFQYERPIGRYAWDLKRVIGKYWGRVFTDQDPVAPTTAAQQMATEMRAVINRDE